VFIQFSQSFVGRWSAATICALVCGSVGVESAAEVVVARLRIVRSVEEEKTVCAIASLF